MGWSVCCHHPHRSPPVDLPVFTLICLLSSPTHISTCRSTCFYLDLCLLSSPTQISTCRSTCFYLDLCLLSSPTHISTCRSTCFYLDLCVFTLISVCCHHPHTSPPVYLPVFTLILCHHPHRFPPVDLPVFTLISVCATAPEIERRVLYICQRTVFHCNQCLTCML